MKISRNEDSILVVEEKPRLIGSIMIALGAVFAVIGILMLIELLSGGLVMVAISAAILYGFYRLIENIQIRFDRDGGTVEVRRKSLHGLKTTSYPLAEISGTTVKEKFGTSTSGAKSKRSQINLTLKNSEDLIPLTPSFSSGDQYHSIASTIDAWLDI